MVKNVLNAYISRKKILFFLLTIFMELLPRSARKKYNENNKLKLSTASRGSCCGRVLYLRMRQEKLTQCCTETKKTNHPNNATIIPTLFHVERKLEQENARAAHKTKGDEENAGDEERLANVVAKRHAAQHQATIDGQKEH